MSKRRRIEVSQDARARLEAIAALAIPRKVIREKGYLSLVLSTDLFHVGYAVRHWFLIAEKRELLEYNPRLSDLPRLTAETYAEQTAIHLALGLNLVQPGEKWVDYGQRGLFDEVPA